MKIPQEQFRNFEKKNVIFMSPFEDLDFSAKEAEQKFKDQLEDKEKDAYRKEKNDLMNRKEFSGIFKDRKDDLINKLDKIEFDANTNKSKEEKKITIEIKAKIEEAFRDAEHSYEAAKRALGPHNEKIDTLRNNLESAVDDLSGRVETRIMQENLAKGNAEMIKDLVRKNVESRTANGFMDHMDIQDIVENINNISKKNLKPAEMQKKINEYLQDPKRIQKAIEKLVNTLKPGDKLDKFLSNANDSRFANQVKAQEVKYLLGQNDEKIMNMAEKHLRDYYGTEGFARHLFNSEKNKELIRALKTNLRNVMDIDDIRKGIQKSLDETVLKNGIDEMVNKLPDFSAKKEEIDYFNLELWKSHKADKDEDRLTVGIARTNIYEAAKRLGKRFDVKFKEGKKEPEYFVDMAEDRKIYKANTPEWKQHLKDVCQNFGGEKPFEEEDEMLEGKEEKYNDLVKDLKEGSLLWFDDEVEKLDHLKDNESLQRLVGITEDFANELNRDVNEKRDKLQKAVKNTDIDTNSISNDKLRALGPIGELIRLIQEIFGKKAKHNETLNKVKQDVETGKNPTEEINSTRKEYAEKLKKYNGTPLDLIKIYTDPQGTESATLFSIQTNKFPRYHDFAAKEEIEAHMESQLNINDITKIEPNKEGGYAITLIKKSGEMPIDIAIKAKNNKLEISQLMGGTAEVQNNMDGIKKGLIEIAKPEETKQQPEAKQDTETTSKKQETGADRIKELANNNKYVNENGTLKNIGKRTKIHDVIDPKKFKTAKLTINISKNRKTQKELAGKNVDIVSDGKTFNIVKADSDLTGKRLHIYNGDKIIALTKTNKDNQ